MPLLFDWDRANRNHIAKHGVRAEEAEQVVQNDPYDLTFEVVDGEERTVQVGKTNKGRILVVVTTWRRQMVRVITAFPAPRQLRDMYLENRS